MNHSKVPVTFVAIIFLGKLLSDVFTAFSASEFRILLYNDFTCSDTRYE